MKMSLMTFRLYEKPAASERKPGWRSFLVETLISRNFASSTHPNLSLRRPTTTLVTEQSEPERRSLVCLLRDTTGLSCSHVQDCAFSVVRG